MGKELPPKEARLYRLCDEALYYLWDPIGVSGAPEARDEYRAYLPRAFALVKAGAGEELVSYLTEIGGERMGLRPDEEGAAKAADFMLRCRAWVEWTAPEGE